MSGGRRKSLKRRPTASRGWSSLGPHQPTQQTPPRPTSSRGGAARNLHGNQLCAWNPEVPPGPSLIRALKQVTSSPRLMIPSLFPRATDEEKLLRLSSCLAAPASPFQQQLSRDEPQSSHTSQRLLVASSLSFPLRALTIHELLALFSV